MASELEAGTDFNSVLSLEQPSWLRNNYLIRLRAQLHFPLFNTGYGRIFRHTRIISSAYLISKRESINTHVDKLKDFLNYL